MQSLHRATLRSALTVCRGAPLGNRATLVTPQLFRRLSAKETSIPVARLFSQSIRAANSEQHTIPVPNDVVTAQATKTDAPAPNDVAAEQASVAETPAGGNPEYALFVRNFVFETSEDELGDMFRKYTPVSRVSIARDARGMSRGYGFVYFHNAEDMNHALANVNNSFSQGRRIQCLLRERKTRVRTEKPQGGPSSVLFIGNIPFETTDAELNRLFENIPNLVDVRIAIDRNTGWPRGFAHADFSDVESAANAMKRLKGVQIGDRSLRLDFAIDRRSKGPREPEQPETSNAW